MTDRQIVESILSCKQRYTLDSYIDNGFIKFNANDKCTRLVLWCIDLKEIPKEIYKLNHLKYLAISCNQLIFIPEELNYIKDLCTYGNPIFESKDKIELLFNRGFTNE